MSEQILQSEAEFQSSLAERLVFLLSGKIQLRVQVLLRDGVVIKTTAFRRIAWPWDKLPSWDREPTEKE